MWIKRAAVFGLLLLIGTAGMCQVQSGRIVGTITDPQGALVAGATVKAVNPATNTAKTATTGSTGEYVITPVDPGVYNISVTAKGFTHSVLNGVEIQVGQIVRENLSLSIGASTATVEVTATTPLLNSESATVGEVVTNTQIVSLPLNGRGFYQLAQLTPGAALLPPTGNSVAIRPESINGNTISGIRGSAMSFLLDGVDVSEQHQGGTFIQTSIDALQEFSVQQNPYSAEFNRGGGFFNSTTKSGTNNFHGGVFEFLRNDKLDARNYFALHREPLKRNQFGGTIGGPLWLPMIPSGKDRAFFFVSYEGQRLRQGLVENSVVPTAAQQGGDFTALLNKSVSLGLNPCDGTPMYKGEIFDPTTTTVVNGVTCRNSFATMNVIPNGQLSSQAKYLNAYLPTPNTTTGTYSYNPIQSVDMDQFTVRVDDQLTSRNRLFARWSTNDNREADPNASPYLGMAPLRSTGRDVTVGLTTTISNNVIQEFHAHYLWGGVGLYAFMQGKNINSGAGISGFDAISRPGSGSSFPDISWSNYSGVSGSAFDQRPKGQHRKVFEPTDNITIIHGNTTLKMGALVRAYQWLGYDSEQYAGVWSNTGVNTKNPSIASGTGDAYADWMLGNPYSVQRGYPANWFGGQSTYYQGFVQADLHPSRRLTLNVGFRYEYTPWLSPYKDQRGTFDPTRTRPIIVAGHGNTVNLTSQWAAPLAYAKYQSLIQTTHEAGIDYNITSTDKRQFAPRLGFAYRPGFSEHTVVRGGYGIFYEPENGNLDNYNILPYKLAETVYATQNVVPNRTLADFFLGAALGSATTQPTISPSPTHLKMGYDQHWSFGVEQELTKSIVAEASYVGNHGAHLQGSQDLNDPAAGAGTVSARRPYPTFGGITLFTSEIGDTYNSLQTKVEQRLSNGLTFLVSYTRSKFIQSNPSPALGGNDGYEKAISAYDIPNNLAVSFSYRLPIGTGKALLGTANRFTNAVVGGWQVQNISILRSGMPYTPTISSDVANTGVGSQRPIRNGSGKLSHPTLAAWFDRTAFSVPKQYTYGTSRANILHGDMYRQYDASFFKNFAVREGSNVQFRAEFFNISNTASFSVPSVTTIDTTSGGKVTSTFNNPRQIQFALKYNF